MAAQHGRGQYLADERHEHQQHREPQLRRTGLEHSGSGDVNGGGKADILWRHSTGVVSIWLMNGATIALNASVASSDTAWTVE